MFDVGCSKEFSVLDADIIGKPPPFGREARATMIRIRIRSRIRSRITGGTHIPELTCLYRKIFCVFVVACGRQNYVLLQRLCW